MPSKHLHFSGGKLVAEEIVGADGVKKSVDVSNGPVSALTGKPFTAADSFDNPSADQIRAQGGTPQILNQGKAPTTLDGSPSLATQEPQLDANGKNPIDPTNQNNTLTGEPNPNYNPAQPAQVTDTNGQQTTAPQSFFSGANLTNGSRGTAVSQLQTSLGIKADGIFGSQTQAAVKAFQVSHGLKPDGIVGPQTMAALNAPTGSPIQGVASGIQSGKQATTGTTISTGNATMDALFAQLKNASPQTQFSEVYKKIYKDLGIQDLSSSYNAQVKQQSDLQNKKNDEIQEINNNPWYSEGVRVGKLRALDTKYEGKEQILQNQIKLLETNIDNARQDAQYITGQTMDQVNKTAALNETIISKAIDIAENQIEAQQRLSTPDTQIVNAGGRQKLIDTKTGKVIADLGSSSSGGGSSSVEQPKGYIVQSGDTYFSLANRLGTTVDALRAANPNVNENNLIVGKNINLPTAGGGQTISSVTGKPLNDTERVAQGYAQRLTASDAIINNLGSQFTSANSLGGVLPNQLQTPERQQFEQAKRDFINAVLRKESGAAISPTEFSSADKQYFPQAGDSPQTVIQKAANRALKIQALQLEAGQAQGNNNNDPLGIFQ